MQILAPDKRQLLPSVVALLVVLPLSSVPVGFWAALALSAEVLVAFVCGLNAVMDVRDMGALQGIVAGVWFCALLVLTPTVLYHVFAIREFASK